jgi:lactoylglutathione lyase
MKRAFPVIYARQVQQVADFYRDFGFEEQFRLPASGEPGYIGLKRDQAELAITTIESPRRLIGIEVGSAPRFEMFLYVDNVDTAVERLRHQGAAILQEAQDMPWGERVAFVSDPEGNPVALAMRLNEQP